MADCVMSSAVSDKPFRRGGGNRTISGDANEKQCRASANRFRFSC